MSSLINGSRRTASERELAKIASGLKEQQHLAIFLFAVIRWLDDVGFRYGLNTNSSGLMFILTEQWLDEDDVSPEEDFIAFLEREKMVKV